ncbi:MAG TPA: YhgE/Pip domain-containing protein [Bacillota bacterium]|nr:YhgE/Pip domain-containing protein [Bacillota bacterium]
MKTVWKIYSRDIKNIVTSIVVAIIVGGLIFLPSLYAWINIKASWDPYGKTDQIPVAIVNNDEGATVRDTDIHVGDDLVETLKENDSFNWYFTNETKAMKKLEKGDYFSVIVIPDVFSEKLGSVISTPEKAEMDYYVNEKINAIAPKITQKGASVIVEEISGQFVSTVNGVIFEMFNDIGIELEQDMPQIEQFEDYIFTMEKKLPDVKEALDDTYAEALDAEQMIQKAKEVLPEVETAVANGLVTVNEASELVNRANETFNELSPQLKDDLSKVQEAVHEINSFMDDIAKEDISFSEGKKLVSQLMDDASSIEEALDYVITQLADAEDVSEEFPKDEVIQKLTETRDDLRDLQTNEDDMLAFLTEQEEQVNKTLKNINEHSTKMSSRVDDYVSEYNDAIEPAVQQSLVEAKETINNARSTLTTIQEAIPTLQEKVNEAEKSLVSGKDVLERAIDNYPAIEDKVTTIADRIRLFNEETDLNEIIKLLQNDPSAERSFFEEPIVLNEHPIFPIENYGTAMTPFYTVLSIWVGCLLLISVLSTDINPLDKITSRQMYFGRWLTFLTASLLQTLIITVGDVTFIGVKAENPLLFIVFGLFISVIFLTIVYTFVSVVGDIGKALAIIMLVLQIAGAGGTYPVVLLPKFFQMINPFLPFTYAISLMREATGGIIWERALLDMAFLLIFAIVAIVLGMFLKEPMNKRSKKMKEKSRESGLFP